ncbi:unnamed protein product [Prunus brigantina]
MGNVFWSDAMSRRAYVVFGDVVVFDTTFNTNRYGMVFAPSETTDSFVWLLEEFKKAMMGEPPKMIIIHQEAVMSRAIARALASQRHKELMADHVDNNEKPLLPFQTPMQHQMGHIYTRKILEMFEREDFRGLLCLFELVEQDETHCRYKVRFEFWGILCRHILAFLRMKQVQHLLDKYILKRWLQNAKSGVIFDKNHKEVNDCVDGLLLVKRSKICKVVSDLIDSALLCDEGFELLEKSFEDIHGKLKGWCH